MKVSAFAASGHSKAPIGRWHYQVEKELQASGMGWTMLRPHHFMQNLLAQAEYVIKEGAIYSPSGDGKIPYIDPRRTWPPWRLSRSLSRDMPARNMC